MPRKGLEHVKTVRSKGRTYLYFNTGKLNSNGRPIYAKLPPKDSPSFGSVYTTMLGHRNRGIIANDALTVSKLIDLFEKSPKFTGYAAGTKRVYRIYLDVFRDLFGPAPAGLLERRDIVLMIDKRASTPGAANLLLAVVATLYKWARGRGHVTNEPCKDIGELETGEHEPWPDDLVQAALSSPDERVRLSTHLLLYTAQRIGDVCRIRWSDIRDGVLSITQDKTGKTLEIRLHSALLAELDKHPKTIGPILGCKQQTVRNALQEFARKRGHDIVPHGLRKNAVNALLEAGCSIPETAAISGQTMQMVEYYARQRQQPKLGSAAILKWEKAGGTK